MFHRAQHGGIERRLVLLEVQRDVLIARAAQQRPHEVLEDQRREGDVRRDPDAGDRLRREPGALHDVRADDQRGDQRRQYDGRAAQSELEPPPRPHAPNDTEQSLVGRRELDRARHVALPPNVEPRSAATSGWRASSPPPATAAPQPTSTTRTLAAVQCPPGSTPRRRPSYQPPPRRPLRPSAAVARPLSGPTRRGRRLPPPRAAHRATPHAASRRTPAQSTLPFAVSSRPTASARPKARPRRTRPRPPYPPDQRCPERCPANSRPDRRRSRAVRQHTPPRTWRAGAPQAGIPAATAGRSRSRRTTR